MNTARIGILGSHDRPEATNLVVIRAKRLGAIQWETRGAVRWKYLSHSDGSRAFSGALSIFPAGFTDAAAFGVSLSFNRGFLTIEQAGASIAEYPDGKPRRWQGGREPHSIRVHPGLYSVVFRVIDEIKRSIAA